MAYSFLNVPGRFAHDWLQTPADPLILNKAKAVDRAHVVVTAGGARDRPINTIVVLVVCGGVVYVVFFT